jgi:transposase-like protein
MSTLSRNEELVRLYVDEGVSRTQLCKRYGISRDKLKRWLESLGVALRAAPEIAELREQQINRKPTPQGMKRCTCGILIPEEQDQCEFCARRGTAISERQAEEELFSASSFLGNPRNVGRIPPGRSGRHIIGTVE